MMCPVCGQMTGDRLICSHCGAMWDAPTSAHSTSYSAHETSDDFLFWAAGGVMYTSGRGNLAPPMIHSTAINPPVDAQAFGHLVVYPDDDSWGGTAVPLDERDVTIGRSTECTICLAHDSQVSTVHAIISFRGAGYALSDVGSSNGTLLNNVPIADERPLHEGDVIRIGQCELVYSSVPHDTHACSDVSSSSSGSSLEAPPATTESAEFATRVVAVHTSMLLPSLVTRFVQHMLALATGFRVFQTRVNKNARVLAVNMRVKVSRSKRLK